MFKIENTKELPSNETEKMEDEMDEPDEEKDEDDELKTGSPKVLLTAIGIGYHNLTKTLI
jgi:hypothetical protein